jgi:prepilin-type N-terminal cleavage/methylation domain-containing protein
MKKSFTLVEILIVVAILGILAAIVLPTLQGHIQQAKESAAKDTLRILRNIIELYAARHNGIPPGYSNDNPSLLPSFGMFSFQMIVRSNYIPKIPKNPFNGQYMMKMIGNDEDFPTEPFVTKIYGWIYKPATKEIRLNWSGTDSAGVAYFNY